MNSDTIHAVGWNCFFALLLVYVNWIEWKDSADRRAYYLCHVVMLALGIALINW